MEWLNEHTSEDLALYAVEIELWQIDASKPALRFNVLSKPTEIARVATAIKSGGPITDTKKLQLEFWTLFRDQLLKRKEAEIGEPLQWNPYPEKQDKIIMLDCAADLDDHSQWDNYISWLVDYVDKFRKAFSPRIKALNLAHELEITLEPGVS
jgi:Domain of unknown function (DUF4268)